MKYGNETFEQGGRACKSFIWFSDQRGVLWRPLTEEGPFGAQFSRNTQVFSANQAAAAVRVWKDL